MKILSLSSLGAISLLFVSSSIFQSPDVNHDVRVTKTEHPQKRLDFEVDIAAPVDQVWKCFATRNGMISWITPDAELELKPGGKWLAMYPGAAPGGGTIISYAAEQQITLHAMAPEQFPNVRREGTTAVFTFMALDEAHTRVHLSQVGWKTGQEWETAYGHLAIGNTILLTQLRDRFVNGPTDWAKVLKNQTTK
jgi:uncharacterized protein YndB with AHSA1/START domain